MTYRSDVAQPLVGAAIALLLLTLVPSTAAAQYFGRNKVQYETFDFRVLDTEHFAIHFYPEAELGVTDAARMAERWRTRLARVFDHELSVPNPIILYADHPDFMQTNVIDAILGEATGGVTEGLRTRVIMPLTGIYQNTDDVLGHELVHAFQYDIAQAPRGTGLAGMGRLPLWWIEGMAEYLALGREDPHTAMWIRDALLNDRLPTTDVLTRDPRYFPYRFGQAFWAYVAGIWGDEAIGRLWRASLRGGVNQAIRSVLQVAPDTLSMRWHEAIRAEYGPLLEGRTAPTEAGQPILTPDIDAGRINLAPALSPDGSVVAFLSERDLFTIDLFLADAETGRVLRRVFSETSDPHYDALSFVRSAGSWSPDSRFLAAVVFRRGTNDIAIIDVETGRVDRHVSVPGIGAMWDPAWSPDGRRIAFAGAEGGISNLYLHDLETGSTQQLTDGRSAVLHPTWSPDGRMLAYVTDAGPGTDFQQLVYGRMRLVLHDTQTGATQRLEIFDGPKHINPQFSPDGASLYFVSDRGGFSDVYRVELATGDVFQVTRLATGVSGITDLSFAMSVSRQTGRLLFSVFDDGNYHVYGLTAAEAQGTPLADAPAAGELGQVLPPREAQGRGIVAAYLQDPVTGLADPATFAQRDYSPGLALDYIGVPGLGVAFDPMMGTMLGGGVAAYFSDMLGDRVLGVEAFAQGELRDAGGQLFYMNRRQRWNWLAGAGRIPFIWGFAQVAPPPPGAPGGSFEVQQFRERIINNQALVNFRYPFDMSRRFEAGIGFTNIDISLEVDRFLVVNRRVVDHQRETLVDPPALNLFHPSAAFVGDNSFFGFTSPVRGWRYRVEVSPYFGSLQFQQALADYRQYWFRMPFTFAIRGLHFGRYGRDSGTAQEFRRGPEPGERSPLQPLFLGFETLIRGYSFGSFRAEECTQVETNQRSPCPEFDRLRGSRIAVANVELRAPLFGTRDFGLIEFPWLPTEVSAFFDAGVAWWQDDSPELRFERDTADRVPVFSAGFSSRFNILGYLVLEAYWAYPFQRPVRGGHWGFHIAPGW